ncbi:hypothetical protein C7C46_09860 [Streptomyces tateyamensis]|uniref:SHOCT domain-containing protein n=1 Tax=Streptomyces tateyamensis TaxID=565073 RepID=A0A2V4NFQ3_9ACTN|nr:SHOCT domain-containing protein [Streptomyces tateyamensis]PYC82655.1 hypothetical protein C7C46_09860 [Streptomyces tateyamensis]
MIHNFDHGGMNGWGYGLMTLIILILICLIVLVALLAYHRLGDRHPSDRQVTSGRPDAHHPDPERLLAERYAHGEIDDDEYQRRLKVLRDHA